MPTKMKNKDLNVEASGEHAFDWYMNMTRRIGPRFRSVGSAL